LLFGGPEGIALRDAGDALMTREERGRSLRTEQATERMHKAMRRLNQEMREILRDAKARHVAEPVD